MDGSASTLGALSIIKFPQPAPLLSLNDRAHWAKKARLTAAWREAAWAAGNGVRRQVRRRPCYVTVFFPVPDKRRRDPHNFIATVKPIVDGLVDARLWPDDTPEWVTVTEPVLVVGLKLVQIELEPRKEQP